MVTCRRGRLGVPAGPLGSPILWPPVVVVGWVSRLDRAGPQSCGHLSSSSSSLVGCPGWTTRGANLVAISRRADEPRRCRGSIVWSLIVVLLLTCVVTCRLRRPPMSSHLHSTTSTLRPHLPRRRDHRHRPPPPAIAPQPHRHELLSAQSAIRVSRRIPPPSAPDSGVPHDGAGPLRSDQGQGYKDQECAYA